MCAGRGWEWNMEEDKRKKTGKVIMLGILCLAGVAAGAFVFGSLALRVEKFQTGEPLFSAEVMREPIAYVYGLVFPALLLLVYFALAGRKVSAKKLMSGKAKGLFSPLENSRFLTDKERDKYFPHFRFSGASEVSKDGVPVRAVLDSRGKELEVNVCPGAHSLVIGATGSGKTTTFINPMIQIIAETSSGSSMIMTDPKGELFSLHSKKLKLQGYDVKVLDLRDTYSSYRWNPLESIWNMYQDYVEAGKGIKVHKDSIRNYPKLEKQDDEELYGQEDGQWYEYRGLAYARREDCGNDVSVARQKIYDEMYEDLNDLVSVICPIESKDDPVWEKGARSIIMATLLAMLEDSENPELNMTKEKYNFYNLNKIIANSENEFEELKKYFEGRSNLSSAVTLSRQVLSAADSTLSSYMSDRKSVV